MGLISDSASFSVFTKQTLAREYWNESWGVYDRKRGRRLGGVLVHTYIVVLLLPTVMMGA